MAGENVTGPQVVEFIVDVGGQRKVIGVPASDAAALVAILKTRTRDGPSVAAKIAQSTRLLAGGSVEIKVGQDEEVLSALDLLRAQRGTLDLALRRLESALRSKIAADDG